MSKFRDSDEVLELVAHVFGERTMEIHIAEDLRDVDWSDCSMAEFAE